MHVIKFSGGNDSIALVQYCIENGLKECTAVFNDTGWASPEWEPRMKALERWLDSNGIPLIRLQSEGMLNLATRKKSWPSFRGQFCTSELKIIPFQKWIEDFDPDKDSICMVGIRRAESNRRSSWPEWVEESEIDGGRSAWAPLVNHTDEQRDELIYRAGWTPLGHRSMECFPCIYATKEDLKLLTEERIDQIEEMETAMGFTRNDKPRTFFRPSKRAGNVGIRNVVEWAKRPKGFNKDQGELFSCDSGFCGG